MEFITLTLEQADALVMVYRGSFDSKNEVMVKAASDAYEACETARFARGSKRFEGFLERVKREAVAS